MELFNSARTKFASERGISDLIAAVDKFELHDECCSANDRSGADVFEYRHVVRSRPALHSVKPLWPIKEGFEFGFPNLCTRWLSDILTCGKNFIINIHILMLALSGT